MCTCMNTQILTVVRNYTAAKSTELTVKKDEEVRIVDATAYIEVIRFKHHN